MPVAMLDAPDAILDYAKPANQAPVAALRRAHPIQGVLPRRGRAYRGELGRQWPGVRARIRRGRAGRVYSAVLVFVFGGLDAPGASDIIWVMLDKIVIY